MAEGMTSQQIDPILVQMCVNSPLRDRRIFLNEEVNPDSIFKVIYWLDRISEIDKKIGNKDPIEIIIDTYGGDAYSTLALCSKMKSMINSGYEIITVVQTTAFSAGFWILSCGSKRKAYANSRIMVHASMGGIRGRHQDMIDDLEEAQEIWNRLKKITTDNTKITNKRMEELKKCKFDLYFWGDEALEYGVVDIIL